MALHPAIDPDREAADVVLEPGQSDVPSAVGIEIPVTLIIDDREDMAGEVFPAEIRLQLEGARLGGRILISSYWILIYI
jgi:hypothetical protein